MISTPLWGFIRRSSCIVQCKLPEMCHVACKLRWILRTFAVKRHNKRSGLYCESADRGVEWWSWIMTSVLPLVVSPAQWASTHLWACAVHTLCSMYCLLLFMKTHFTGKSHCCVRRAVCFTDWCVHCFSALFFSQGAERKIRDEERKLFRKKSKGLSCRATLLLLFFKTRGN